MSADGLPDASADSVSCPLCGEDDPTPLFVARDRLLGRPGSFPVVRCRACGLVYLNPRPTADALGAFYPDTYYPLDAEPSPAALGVARGLLERVDAWLRASPHSNSAPAILDVGCGTGLFLRLARERGWDVKGIELSDSAVAYARERCGLPVEQGTLETSVLPEAAYDVITLWHVLEHLPRPVEALRQVAAALKPGGLLLIGVPNAGSLEARLFGRRWYSLDAPRHLAHFTPGTMRQALERAGLRLERIVQSNGSAGLVYSLMGDLTGVSLKLRRRPLSEDAYRTTATSLARLASPVCRLLARLGSGGALEVYATRP